MKTKMIANVKQHYKNHPHHLNDKKDCCLHGVRGILSGYEILSWEKESSKK
jgi:hypothetical protein